MAFKATDSQVKNLSERFDDHNDVLNSLWLMGVPVEELRKATATTEKGTNRTVDIVTRLLNNGVITAEQVGRSADLKPAGNAYNWPFTKTGNGVQAPNHADRAPATPGITQFQEFQMGPDGKTYPGAAPYIYRSDIKQPAPPPPAPPLGADRRGGAPPAGGGSPNPTVTVVQAPPVPDTKKGPKSPAEVEKFIRERYGSYSWMLDDPAFDEVRGVLRRGAEQGLGEVEMEAQLKGTAWWKALDADQRKWDIDEKTGGTTIANKIETNKQYLAALASQMGLSLDDGRLTELAKQMGRNAWTELEVKGALAGEAAYKPDYGGDIGIWESKAKEYGRQYMAPITDEGAFDWAKKAVGGLIDEDNLKSHFIQQAIALLPEYEQQLAGGVVTARQILNPQIGTIARLLEMGEEEVDLIGDTRFSNIISNPEKRVLSVAETSQLVKKTDDYWKTQNASKEVSGLINGLAQSFGKLSS